MSAKWFVWGALLGCVVAVGCSGRSKRDVPLPPGVEPSDLFNVVPAAPVAVVDARPFYLPDDATVSAGVADPKRVNQRRAGEKVPSSEFNVKQYRAAERTQLRQKSEVENDRERKEKLKEIENKKSEVDTRLKRHEFADQLGGLLLGVADRLLPGAKDNAPATSAVESWLKDGGLDVPLKGTFGAAELAANRAEAKRLEAARKAVADAPPPDVKPGAKYDFLVLSGGGSQALYLYGVVCGWADANTMPDFRVITGVSGGSLAAALLFAGKGYLTDLRRIFLSLDQKRPLHGDAWDAKRFPHPLGLGTDSVATSAKIRKLARQVLGDPDYFGKVAAEHAKGRRLYVGTTNMDTQRFVVWDMGAIAAEGTAESRQLYEDVLVASAAIPPLLEPSRIVVTIDGRRYEEMHSDGGTARNLFFYPPSDWPGDEEDKKTGYRLLAGARVHVVLGGKVYDDPSGTPPKLLGVGLRGLSTALASLQRAELARIYSHCMDRDMTIRLAAIPSDYPLDFPVYKFDPANSAKLFCEGYAGAQDGRAWDDQPPERAVSEERARRGSTLTSTPATENGPLFPVRPPALRGQVRVGGR